MSCVMVVWWGVYGREVAGKIYLQKKNGNEKKVFSFFILTLDFPATHSINY